MFRIVLYRLRNGKAPVEEFIKGLEPKMRAKALASLQILSDKGNALRMPFSRAVGDGLFELRIQFSNDISRIFYFFFVDNEIVLTNGFIKKTERTPPAELELARKYKRDYEGRKQNG